MNKEEIYDSQVSPLMQQVIQIARDNGIAMIASFAFGHEEGGPNGEDAIRFTVTTHLPDGDGEFDERFSKSANATRNGMPLPGIKAAAELAEANPELFQAIRALPMPQQRQEYTCTLSGPVALRL